MELIDLVSELLYKHNCVIIPGFGGFVGNFKSTDFDESRLLVSPSRKKVAFNQSLIENDGLLINALMTRKGITYEQAEKEVTLFTKFLNDRLEKYKNYEFKNIGSLYLNKEGKLIFVAYEGLNFHKKSFGLQDIKVKRLQHVVASEKPQEAAQDKNSPTPTKVVPMPVETKKKRFYIPQIAASVAILTIFGVMLWQLLQTSARYDLAEHKTAPAEQKQESTASMLPDMDSDEANNPVIHPEEEQLPADARVSESMTFENVTESVLQNNAEEENGASVQQKEDVEEYTENITDPEEGEETVSEALPVEVTEAATNRPTPASYERPVYYIAVAKNYSQAVGQSKRTRLERMEYNVFEKEIDGDRLLCLEKFISRKNAQDYLYLVKLYDDRNAFIFETLE